MLISKTVCSAGTTVGLVPLGLQLTLHYDARGNLMKVYQGYETKCELSDDFMKALVRMGRIPTGIKLIGGSTDVWGVFTSDVITAENSLLPDCEYERIKADILSGDPNYRFYVTCITTGAETMINSSSVQNWARGSGFITAPFWMIPTDANDQVLQTYVENFGKGVITFPKIAGYVIYENDGKPTYYSNDLRTAAITKVKKYVDINGYIKYDASYGEKHTITMNYPDAARFNIQKGSQVILDRGQIIWSSTADDVEGHLVMKLTCEHCGKLLQVPPRGIMSCDDPFCTSVLYPRIEKFCRTLGLVTLPQAKFKKYVKSQELQILPDLLLLEEYKEESIEKSLYEFMYAVIPDEVCLDVDWLKRFCNKCSNQYATVKYYLDGPRRIATELDMEVPVRFMRWVSEPRNLTELDTILTSANIHMTSEAQAYKFDAMPILHDRTIFITGTFMHGNYDEITAILQSYSATVVTEFDECITDVLVGDIKENISGEAILGARALKIPVVDESVFFNHYRIDEDLENLV